MSAGGFDKEAFAVYRAATGETKRRLLGELVMANKGLTTVLVAQLTGRGENRPGRRQAFRKEPGAELLDPEEAMAAGVVGMMKAIRDFNPKKKAGLAIFAGWKIRNDIQAAILKARMIYTARGTTEEQGRPKAFDYLDGEELDRVLDHEAAQEETLVERWRRENEEDAAAAAPVRPVSAIADFVTRRCEFRPFYRILRDRLFGAYEHHARLLGFPVATHQLERQLSDRGVRLLGGHVEGEPGRYFAGVRVLTIQAKRSQFLPSEQA